MFFHHEMRFWTTLASFWMYHTFFSSFWLILAISYINWLEIDILLKIELYAIDIFQKKAKITEKSILWPKSMIYLENL